jgi:Ca2+-binding EF-hand superfamily protein
MDQTLAGRYGTSLQVNMGREFQKQLRNKYRELQDEFLSIDKNSDDKITIDELIDFLNKNSDAVLFFRNINYLIVD